MEYTFDNVKNREYTNSFKWSAKNLDYEKGKIYPMWVADMEFSVSPAIKRRIIERLDENVYGYEMLSDHYYEAVKYWLKNRHSCKVEKENIMYCSSTMCGLSIVLQTFTLQEDEILLMPPVYGNFYKAVCGCGRKVVESPLMEKNERFTMDFCNMEKVISNRTKGVLLCNPHNPTGTVWKRTTDIRRESRRSRRIERGFPGLSECNKECSARRSRRIYPGTTFLPCLCYAVGRQYPRRADSGIYQV